MKNPKSFDSIPKIIDFALKSSDDIDIDYEKFEILSEEDIEASVYALDISLTHQVRTYIAMLEVLETKDEHYLKVIRNSLGEHSDLEKCMSKVLSEDSNVVEQLSIEVAYGLVKSIIETVVRREVLKRYISLKTLV